MDEIRDERAGVPFALRPYFVLINASVTAVSLGPALSKIGKIIVILYILDFFVRSLWISYLVISFYYDS